MSTNRRLLLVAGLLTSLCTITACVVTGGGGGGGPIIAQFTIAGKTFTFKLGLAGQFQTKSGESARNVGEMTLWEEPPTDTPAAGEMRLRSSDITVSSVDSDAERRAADTPINGSATVRFSVADVTSSDPCATGVFMAEFALTVVDNAVTVEAETQALSNEALAILLANDVAMCIEVTADFNGQLVMTEFDLEFSGDTVEDGAANDNEASPDGDGNEEPDNTDDNANDNAGDNANDNVSNGEGAPTSGDIFYAQTVTRIVEPDDLVAWYGDDNPDVNGLVVSADGSRVAFHTGVYTGGAPANPRLFVVNSDGSGLTDLTDHMHPDMVDRTWGDYSLTNDGSRLFFMGSDETYGWGTVYYFDVDTLSVNIAVHSLSSVGYKKNCVPNGLGTRIFFRHSAGSDITERGIYYCDVPGEPVKLAGLDQVSEYSDTALLNMLDASADGTTVLFTYGGWGTGGAGTTLPRTMYTATIGNPVATPNEEHQYIWDVQDLPHRMISADGSVATFFPEGTNASDERYSGLYLVDTATGAKTTIHEGGDYGPVSLSYDGTHLLLEGTEHNMAVINLATDERRDTFFSGSGLTTWATKVSNLCADAHTYYVSSQDEAAINRVDFVSPDYSKAPQITNIEFSAPSVVANDDPPEITVRATVTDAQGLSDIEWVRQDVLIDGLADREVVPSAPLMFLEELKDDGTDGDAVAGDGVFTYNRVKARTSSDFFEVYDLPYEVDFRIIAKDKAGNFGVADMKLLITAE